MESFLPLIEAQFTPVLSGYGFLPKTLEASTAPTYADVAVFVDGHRSVTVGYAQTRERWCEVSIEGYGDPQPIRDLFDFVRGLGESYDGYRMTDEPKAFAREAERCCSLLVEYCGDFLSGDVGAFRRRYRELLLVGSVRNARYNAEARNDTEGVELYDRWLRDYARPLPR